MMIWFSLGLIDLILNRILGIIVMDLKPM